MEEQIKKAGVGMTGFNKILDPFYYKSIRAFKNEKDLLYKEVAIIEKGQDVYFIIDRNNKILLRSSAFSLKENKEIISTSKKESVREIKKIFEPVSPQYKNQGTKKYSIAKIEAEQIVNMMVENFMKLFKKYVYAIITEKTFSALIDVMDSQKNKKLLEECMRGGLIGLKAYCIREFFKNTAIKDRGFKILVFLTCIIALNKNGELVEDIDNEIGNVSIEQGENILKDFIDFLEKLGVKYQKKNIFENIYTQFKNKEYKNLEKGGIGYFLEQFYYKELEELKENIINEENKDYITDLFQRAMREPLYVIKSHVVSYLKALAILRLYKSSTKEERCRGDIDDKTTEEMILDIINYEIDMNDN